jgi:dihydroflavonol-4-reductase
MNVLITGGTGFIGSRLCAACVARGDRVRVLRRERSRLVALARLPVEFVVGDLLDGDALARAVGGCDLVFHAAAISSYWRARRDQIERVNVDGTRALVDACLRAGVPRLVHTSSAAAVGIASAGMADEATPFDELSATFAYATSKRRAEEIVRAAIPRGLAVVIVNPAVVIGAGDHYLNAGSMVVAYGRGRVPVVPPGGACVADVDAVTQGHLAAAERGRVGERYILGGENLSYLRLAQTIAEAAGVRPPRLVVPAGLLGAAASAVDAFNRVNPRPPTLTGEQVRLSRLNYFFDSTKAVNELGYPLMPARQAVSKALAWYRAHGYL